MYNAVLSDPVGSLAETPEGWYLEFQQAEIFADNLVIFANNLLYISSLILMNVDKNTKSAEILKKYFYIFFK